MLAFGFQNNLPGVLPADIPLNWLCTELQIILIGIGDVDQQALHLVFMLRLLRLTRVVAVLKVGSQRVPNELYIDITLRSLVQGRKGGLFAALLTSDKESPTVSCYCGLFSRPLTLFSAR